MMTLLYQTMSLLAAAPSGSVRVLADISSAGDGTSNGAIMRIVLKGQAILCIVTTGWFGWKVFGVYTEKSGGQASGPGGGGGGGGGQKKKLVDELTHFALALGLIVSAYPITDIILDVFGGLMN